MNKRQKKKLYKKLHGHNPPERPKRQCSELPQSQLKQIKDATKIVSELNKQIEEQWHDIADRIRGIAKTMGESFTEYMKSPWFWQGIETAKECFGQCATQTMYFDLGCKKKLPCIVTTEALTRQQAAGKRKKYHTRNGRKRKWH